MLGAPALADSSGHYTVCTMVDPVLGDTGSGDWASTRAQPQPPQHRLRDEQ